MIIEGIMKGLAIWVYNLLLEIVEFIADALLDVFNMDVAYFESNVPVTKEIMAIILAAGWAVLIGNLTFQAVKSMMSGIGFEGEDPKILFARTFVFAFLLLASRQICEIGLNMASTLNTLMQTPNAVSLGLPQLDVFSFPGSWLLVIIIGVVLMFQLIRFFFEMAERYVVLAVLTVFAPLAFGVGGSKNTEEIFRGWARIYASACLMMVFNTAFLKLLLSAMSNMPGGEGSAVALLPWTLLVVGIARVARKIDDIVARIGLNTARTGEPLGRGGIMFPIMVARSLSGVIGKTVGAAKSAPTTPKTGTRGSGAYKPPSAPPPPPPPPSPAPAGGGSPAPSAGGGNGGAAASPQVGNIPGGAPISGTDYNSAPTRPPVGVRGENSGKDRNHLPNTGQAPSTDAQEQIFGCGSSRGSGASRAHDRRFNAQAEFGGHGGNQPNSATQQHPGLDKPNTAERGGGRSGNLSSGGVQPPLSAETRTPGASASQQTGTGAGKQNNSQSGRKVNIDIYRDDDPPIRNSQKRPPIPNSAQSAGNSGVSARQGAAASPAGTAMAGRIPPSNVPPVSVSAGKIPQTNVKPAETTAKQGAASNTGQSGVVQAQIPTAPANAASQRGGRISGGTVNPSGAHRATSKAATVSAEIRQGQTARSNNTQSIRAAGTPARMSAGNPQAGASPARYRVANRSNRDMRANHSGEQRPAPSSANKRASNPAQEQETNDNKPNQGTRNTTPAPIGPARR